MFALYLEAQPCIPASGGLSVLDVEDGNKFFRHVGSLLLLSPTRES